jgi:hypothetical protein
MAPHAISRAQRTARLASVASELPSEGRASSLRWDIDQRLLAATTNELRDVAAPVLRGGLAGIGQGAVVGFAGDASVPAADHILARRHILDARATIGTTRRGPLSCAWAAPAAVRAINEANTVLRVMALVSV